MSATLAGAGAGKSVCGRSGKAVESHQHADKQHPDADQAFQGERRQAFHVACHQPNAEYDQSQRQEVHAPAKTAREQLNPFAAQRAAVGRKQAENGQQADDHHAGAEDIHLLLRIHPGGNAVCVPWEWTWACGRGPVQAAQ